MSRWIECLGGFALSDGGTPLPVAARKPQILLGLLAVARHRALPRARLAALLWEYSDAESARVSLRQALARLRRVGGASLLEVEGDRVRLSASVSTDVDAFADALSRGDDAEAARLYGGPFLDGALPDGPDLEAAIVAERARLADLATGALRRDLARLGDRPDAAQAAHRLLSLDPLDEAAHRHLMRADAAHGARGAARARYEGLREALRRDLGTEPEVETTALMDRIRRAGLTDRTPAPPAPAAPPAADDPPLLLMALETDGAADWAAFQSTARAEGGRMVDCGPGEGAVLWPGTPLRDVANTALRMAAGSGDALSFGLVAEAGGAPSGAEPPTSGTFARARRVAARADPGEVWVSPDLAPRLGLATDGRGPAPLSPDATPERPVTPLVGRDLELAQTDSALAAARVAGTGLAIHLSGEAGIGKSRLAAEIVRREMAQGARVARVGFAPLGRGTRHVAQALMAALPPLPEDAIRDPATRAVGASLTGAAMSPEAELRLSALSGDVRRARMIDLLADAFDHAAASSDRLLVVIEDCHWAPTGIGGFLLDLCDRLTGSPVSFVLTERPHGADLGRRLAARARLGVVRLDLGPLAPGAAADLAAAVAADRADVAAVLDRAAGHPLFLLRLMEAGWSAGDLPASITGLVLEQIERLPPADRAALRRAAILGSAFDPAEVAAIFPDVSPPRPQGDLIHATETSLAFGHDLIRQAIHDAIPEESRRLWHGQAAAHYREVDPLRWADHALLGEDDAEACRAATAAANAMIADMRMTAAAGYIEAGLARGGDAEAVAELHSCRAGIRRMRGDLRGALADYRDAHAAATADRTRVAMLVRQALVLHRLGQGATADRALDAAEGIADRTGLSGRERAEIHEQRGNRAFVAGDAAECLAQHRRALAAAMAVGDPRAIARAHGGLGDAHVLSGHLRTAHRHFEDAVTMAAEAGLGMVHQEYVFMRGYTLLFAEPGARAHLMADLAVDGAVEASAGRAEMLARNVRAELRLTALDLDGAAADIARIAELVAGDPEPRFLTDLALLRGWLALRRGDRAAAFRTLEPAFDEARESSYNGPVILMLGALSAADAGTREALLAAGEARLAAGTMAPTAIAYHCFALELASRGDDLAGGRRHARALDDLASREPLGMLDLARRAAALRFGAPPDPAAEASLRADLAAARLAGLSAILDRSAADALPLHEGR